MPSSPCLLFGSEYRCSRARETWEARGSRSAVPDRTALPMGPVLQALGVGKVCKLVLREEYISPARRILSLWHSVHSHSHEILQIIQSLQKVKLLSQSRIPQTPYLSFGSSSGKKQFLRDYQSDSLSVFCSLFFKPTLRRAFKSIYLSLCHKPLQ